MSYQNVASYPCRTRTRVGQTSGNRVAGKIYLIWPNGSRHTLATRYYDPASYGRNYSMVQKTSDCLHPGPPYRSGGPFASYKQDAPQIDDIVGQGSYLGKPASYRYEYVGGFYCVPNPSTWGCLPSKGVLDDFYDDEWASGYSHGATAWNRFKPGRSSVDLGVAIGEIRDLPRMLKTTAKGFYDLWKSEMRRRRGFNPRKLAGHWLNHQFGWLPFVSDVRRFYLTYKDLDRKLKHLRRINNRWVHRRGTVDQTSDLELVSESSSKTAHGPGLASALYADGVGATTGSNRQELLTSDNIWFSASFRHWIPGVPGSVGWNRRAVAELMGLEITPSLLWELTPWSWLIDWFSNVGDVIANIETDVAARYAYIMRTRTQIYRVSSVLELYQDTLHNTWEYRLTGKTRVGAHPFGVSLTPDLLSWRQWSILSALGIRKSSYR